MSQPVTIDHDTRRITFQIGKVIPPAEMRANYHRLLDLALDALAVSQPLEGVASVRTGTYPDGDPRNVLSLEESFRKPRESINEDA